MIGQIHVEFFADFYQAVSGGSSKVFQLLRDDGILIARYPAISEKLGQSFRSQTAMSLALSNTPNGGAALATRPRLTDPSDQRLRIVSTRRVHEYPLLVTFVVTMFSTGMIESPADSIDDIIGEVAAARVTERGTRADDKASEAAMEDRKKAGYF